jgi:sugar phosphate isomerase/epimerase
LGLCCGGKELAVMKVALGVDTLTYHCRLAESELSVEDVFNEVSALKASYVQLDLHHVKDYSIQQLEGLRLHADALDLGIRVSGDFVGTPRSGDKPEDGVRRIAAWAERARAVGSPVVRVASGFYRAELATQPELIRAEQEYVIATLQRAVETDAAKGVQIILENHSDFTPEEYVEIIETVGADNVGVFLDLINPVSTLSDPAVVVPLLVNYATCGHVKDYRFESIYVPDRYHRRGFEVLWCYPGEGAADLPRLLGELTAREDERTYFLAIEGLDSRAGVPDQSERLGSSLDYLRTLLGEHLFPG